MHGHGHASPYVRGSSCVPAKELLNVELTVAALAVAVVTAVAVAVMVATVAVAVAVAVASRRGHAIVTVVAVVMARVAVSRSRSRAAERTCASVGIGPAELNSTPWHFFLHLSLITFDLGHPQNTLGFLKI